jgi:hypothetical protein
MTVGVLIVGLVFCVLTAPCLTAAIHSARRPTLCMAYLATATASSVIGLMCIMHVLTLPYLEL